jgi:hypothetical protein
MTTTRLYHLLANDEYQSMEVAIIDVRPVQVRNVIIDAKRFNKKHEHVNYVPIEFELYNSRQYVFICIYFTFSIHILSPSLSYIKQQLPLYTRLAINKISRANIVVIADAESTSTLFIDALPPDSHPLRKMSLMLTDVSVMLCACQFIVVVQSSSNNTSLKAAPVYLEGGLDKFLREYGKLTSSL